MWKDLIWLLLLGLFFDLLAFALALAWCEQTVRSENTTQCVLFRCSGELCLHSACDFLPPGLLYVLRWPVFKHLPPPPPPPTNAHIFWMPSGPFSLSFLWHIHTARNGGRNRGRVAQSQELWSEYVFNDQVWKKGFKTHLQIFQSQSQCHCQCNMYSTT